MKLWHTIFVVSFITIYGSLSVMFLGTWIYEAAKVLTDTRRQALNRMARAGAVIGATVVATALVGMVIGRGIQVSWP